MDGGVRGKTYHGVPLSQNPAPPSKRQFFLLFMNPPKAAKPRIKSIYHRVKKPDFYTKISNEIAKNNDLSMGAKGLLLTIFSNTDDWFVNREYLLGCSNKDGKKTIKKYMKEIEANGYARFKIEWEEEGFCNTWEFFNSALPYEERSNRTFWRSETDNSISKVLPPVASTQEQSTHTDNNIENKINDNKVLDYEDYEEIGVRIRGLSL